MNRRKNIPIRDKLWFGLVILIWRVAFLFVDTILLQEQMTQQQNLHYSAVGSEQLTTNSEQWGYEASSIQYSSISTGNASWNVAITMPLYQDYENDLIQEAVEEIQENLNLSPEEIDGLGIKDVKKEQDKSLWEDIFLLEKLYKKTKNPSMLKVLIEKLAQDYQFDKAYEYLGKLIKLEGYETIDPHVYIHVIINSSAVSVMKESSIEKMRPFIEDLRVKGLLSQDDYRFYQGLFKIWYHDYDGAQILFKQITSPRYDDLFASLDETLSQISTQQDIKSYYKDALVSLVMLKHGYFSVAKKLALEVVLQNDEYILPYQILAYSHFLTNNWDTATEYFYRLIDLDQPNQYLYKFLIWVSYYRWQKYEQSVLFLSQVANLQTVGHEYNQYVVKAQKHLSALTTDVYRYLLLNYIAKKDEERMLRTWQYLLGQNDIQKADFYTYFYEVLYKPFINGKSYNLYEAKPDLAETFVAKCYEALIKEQHDVCVYGDAGVDFLRHHDNDAKSKLLYLAKNYPQAYIFHTLWDFYYRQNQTNKAKTYYIKAVSMTDNESEEGILKRKLTKFVTDF